MNKCVVTYYRHCATSTRVYRHITIKLPHLLVLWVKYYGMYLQRIVFPHMQSVSVEASVGYCLHPVLMKHTHINIINNMFCLT